MEGKITIDNFKVDSAKGKIQLISRDGLIFEVENSFDTSFQADHKNVDRLGLPIFIRIQFTIFRGSE